MANANATDASTVAAIHLMMAVSTAATSTLTCPTAALTSATLAFVARCGMIAPMALTCDLNSATWFSMLPKRFKISSTSPPPLPEPADALEVTSRRSYRTTFAIKHPPNQKEKSMNESMPAVAPTFYSDKAENVNIQLPVTEEDSYRCTFVDAAQNAT